MECTAELEFLRKILRSMNISSCMVEGPEEKIPPEIDLGLRADLYSLDNYADFLQNSMSQAENNTVYRFYDEYDCNYIFLRLSDDDRYFFIGPYLLALPSEEHIAQRAVRLGLNPEQTKRMKLYYTGLPLLEDENLLLTMTNTLAVELWGSPEKFSLEYVDYAIPDRYEPIPISNNAFYAAADKFELSTLEERYANENLLIDAVSKGKLNLVTAVASNVFNSSGDNRLPDSLRDRKNYLVILKTLLRKAAEYGGVHPLHIHALSSSYALKIENLRTVKQSFNLQDDMIRSYCKLVKKHSLSRYSYYVAQTITLVQYDLTADLSLKSIADRLNVNSSYLSDLFHREYGCTLTSFVNKSRIDHSLMLLRLTAKPIQEVANECGIGDVNYFIKLFKKHTGFTPKHYRDQIGQ